MKLGLIGTGMIVNELLSVIYDIKDIHLNAIVSTKKSENIAKQLAKKYSIKSYTSNYDEVLNSAEIDTIYIGIPNNLHYEYTKKALLAGKNVICEKPFTLSSFELKELINIAIKNNLILLEAITTKYLPNYFYIKENLTKLGNIKIISCNYSQYSSRYDNFKKGIISPAFDVNQGGGALLDINIYNIHLIEGLFGKPKKVNYIANIENGVDTSGILTMKYDDKCAACIGSKDNSSDIFTTIQGDLGYIKINGATNSLPSITMKLNSGFEETVDYNDKKHRMYYEFIKFKEIIKNNDIKYSKYMLESSLNVMEIIDIIEK